MLSRDTSVYQHVQARGKGERILVVDDEPSGRLAIKLFLSSAGYAVEVVPSGETALAQLERGHFDLVITDNAMPGMSGLELASAIKTRWPALPIVMFSAGPPQEPVACLDLALSKPGDVSILLRSLRQILDRAVQ